MAHAVPYHLSIEPTEGESFMYGYHLGTDLRVARACAEEIAHKRTWFAGRGNVTIRTVALMTADRQIVDVCEGGEKGRWASDAEYNAYCDGTEGR